MSIFGEDKNEIIDGIYCIVSNCAYHTTENSCSARQIKVDNQTATSPHETSCATFELKD